ncbi:branched-chain amino acid ABC transporter permease [Candidatus Thioglobus sp.]|nr:branched-chain amino acid ABC transporter permease [Candidatus Thioglobus sp.]
MNEFLQLLIVGISQGCIYGLMALGFVMIYKATEMINFAQGDMMMLGSFVAWTLIMDLGIPFWLGVPATLIIMASFGALVDILIVRRVIGQPQFAVIILTLGLGIIFRAAAGMIWGQVPLTIDSPISGSSSFYGIVIGNERLVIIAVTAVLIAILWAYFRYSKWGIAMKAASQNQLAAYYSGIPVRVIISAVWAVAAAISALAGILLAPITLIEPMNGLLGIKAFAAAVIGGFGSMPGAILGGLIVGIIEPFAAAYVPAVKGSLIYVVMLIVLALRPQGLFAQIHKKKL